ncbi:MAG: hypothetical protein Q8N36_04050, partial [bacterium]|nr:hypothetical protein [bacterium]
MPCSLEDSLGVLTKYQLDRIRIDSEIEGLSHLRKQELIDSLVSALPDRVSDHFMTFDSERYALARRIVDNNGYVTGVSLPLNKAEYLKHAGLFVFGKKDGKPALGMPGEFINAFLQCEQAGLGDQVKLNTELIQLTHGLLYYYGVLNLKQAHEFICSLTRANVDYSHYALLIKDISEYHEGISLRLDRIWDSRVFDVDKLQAAQDA